MAVTYNPNFNFAPFVDNVDRVEAGGDNGFNARFQAVERELKAISTAIDQLSDAIDALSELPPAQDQRITFPPTLFQLGTTPWEHVTGGVAKPPGATSARGIMALAFPNGTTIKSIRAV